MSSLFLRTALGRYTEGPAPGFTGLAVSPALPLRPNSGAVPCSSPAPLPQRRHTFPNTGCGTQEPPVKIQCTGLRDELAMEGANSH